MPATFAEFDEIAGKFLRGADMLQSNTAMAENRSATAKNMTATIEALLSLSPESLGTDEVTLERAKAKLHKAQGVIDAALAKHTDRTKLDAA